MEARTNGARVMAAPMATVLNIVADIEKYPQWASQFSEGTVLERSPSGRPRIARFVMNAGILKDTFTLRYTFTESPQGASVVWNLVEAQFLKKLDGMYKLSSEGDSTRVHYELEVDPGLPVLAVLRKRAEETVIKVALEDLAAAVERPTAL